MDLAAWGDIYHDVGVDAGRASQPVLGCEWPLAVVVGFGGAGFAERRTGRGDRPFRKVADRWLHLAPTTDAPSTADGVEVGAELSGGIQDGCALVDLPGQAGTACERTPRSP